MLVRACVYLHSSFSAQYKILRPELTGERGTRTIVVVAAAAAVLVVVVVVVKISSSRVDYVVFKT